MLWQQLRDTAFIVGGLLGVGSRLALGPIAVAPGGPTGLVVSDSLLTPIDLATGRAGATVTFGPATGGLADGNGVSLLDRYRSRR
jgi:hypothetical protein